MDVRNKNTYKALVTLVILGALAVLISVLASPSTPTGAPTALIQEASLLGCYTATLGGDVYTLSIQSQNDNNVIGTLTYANHDKDSSRGTFDGTYSHGILIGDYTFSSEGMNSVRQVAFKKTSDGFVEGFGPITMKGNYEAFTSTDTLDYSSSPVFKTSICGAV